LFMKVEGPNPLRPTAPRRKVGDSGSGDFASALGGDEESSTSSGVTGSSRTSAASSLLSLQSVDSAEGEAAKRRARQRAEDLLSKLDKIRTGLLLGAIPRSHLIGLAQSLKTMRDSVMDPRLTDVLDEIDLRAQVELAKYDPTGR
jgi:hypothetical protein